ncbi:MAG: hypothetical protein D6744_16190, partial [Planctomycetota bacterium]
GTLDLDRVAPVLEHLEQSGERDKAASFAAAALEAVPDGAFEQTLRVARVALLADPKNDEMRTRVIDLYRRVHGQAEGFEQLLEASGLTTGRPARNAVRMLDICLGLNVGDVLISRTEGAAVEVLNVDLVSGLITVRRGGRPRTLSALDLSREYERAEADDLRVLRQLRPEELRRRLDEDPVSVVISVLRSHDGIMNQDDLKHEFVPRYMEPKDWSKWWTRVRNLLKRCPNVRLEGRAPVVLQYSADAVTLEDETWEQFIAGKQPSDWLACIERYRRECAARKVRPDAKFFERCHARLLEHIDSVVSRRPEDAFACALITERLDEYAGVSGEQARQLAVRALREAASPSKPIAALSDKALWSLALDTLRAAFEPPVAAAHAVELIPQAPANMLDELVAIARAGERLEEVQSLIDLAAADPLDYPELVYWLWKGPSASAGLNLPSSDELFHTLIRTLHAIG